ncbi:hypothetical protein M3Y98_00660200 [Aphelenchoides besseyi]|nr:hypothetical protein M3Y98_00660200 [Aphelenchoides besseyi]
MVNLSETIQRRRHERKMELQRQRRQRKREAREEAERERLNGSRRSSLVSAACSSGSSTRRGSMVEINGEIEGERQEWLDRSALIQRIIKEEQEEIELELQNNQNVDMNDVSMYNEVTILDVINMSSQPTEQKDESRIQQRTSERIRQNAEATNLQKKKEKLAKHREVQRDRQRRHRARLSEQAKAREKDESPRSLSQDPKIDEQRQSNGPNLRKRAAPPAKSVESECEELAVEEPSLFDVDHEDYSNDNQRHRAFTRIQERLTASGVALQQATTVRDKFRILKRRFINEYQRHGKDSTWPLFKPLDFLIPYVVAFNERKKLGVPSRKRTYTQKADLPSLAKEKDQLEKISIESLLKLFPESAYTASASSPRTELNVSNLTNGSKRNGAQPTQEDEDFSLSLFFKQNGCDGLNVNVTEGDLDWLMKSDKRLPMNKRRLSFNTYGKSENDSTLFNRIMYRPSSAIEYERTNYVQCRVCNKILVAKLTGGSNPARHRKHCKGVALSVGSSVKPKVEVKTESPHLESAEFVSYEPSKDRELTLEVIDRLANGEIDNCEALDMLDGKGAIAEFVRDLVVACGLSQPDQLGDEAVELTNQSEEKIAVQDGNNRSHEVSRESSISTPSPASEHPTLAAYRIRQTYLFLRVESTNKPVFCKANDEDFFPPNRTNTTVADRVKLRPGQIITAFFGYNQTETTCVVEAVGTLDAVMQQYRQTIVQELQGKMPNGNSSNGSPEGGDNCVEALRSLFPQPQTNQNGEEDRLSPSSSESLVHSPSKMPRLQVESTNNDEIDRRFARLESRIRVLEERVDFEKDQ